MSLSTYKKLYFIGIAGSGMSAIAQYLHWKGLSIAGSDREFGGKRANHIQEMLEKTGIRCFKQNGEMLTNQFDAVVVSTAVETKNTEYSKALQMGLPIVHRTDMLKYIAANSKTIAVSGTSGKSTTVAMLYHILDDLGYSPSLITGAPLNSLKQKGRLGNAAVGNSEWLIIEADESDGTLQKYEAEIGVILNIDNDHKKIEELNDIFATFARKCKNGLIVNADRQTTSHFSQNAQYNFGTKKNSGIYGENFRQSGQNIYFNIKEVDFEIPAIGYHNFENALAAVAVVYFIGGCIDECAKSLKNFEGVERRHQQIENEKGVLVFDDYAHNPVKLSASIKACQQMSDKVITWFQPHGFGPLRFMKNELIERISAVMRNNDEFWVSDVFFSGGTVNKNITPEVVAQGITENGKKSYYLPDRNMFSKQISAKTAKGDVVLITGARDPSLSCFAKSVAQNI